MDNMVQYFHVIDARNNWAFDYGVHVVLLQLHCQKNRMFAAFSYNSNKSGQILKIVSTDNSCGILIELFDETS